MRVFREIADIARQLHEYHNYAKCVQDAEVEKDTAEEFSEQYQSWELLDIRLKEAAHCRALCVELESRVSTLAKLCNEYFPDLPLHLVVSPILTPWHLNPFFNWDAATAELQLIERTAEAKQEELRSEPTTSFETSTLIQGSPPAVANPLVNAGRHRSKRKPGRPSGKPNDQRHFIRETWVEYAKACAKSGKRPKSKDFPSWCKDSDIALPTYDTDELMRLKKLAE